MKATAPSTGQRLNTVFWHLARGIAAAETGKAADARRELDNYHESTKAVSPDLVLGNNTAGRILNVAEKLLAGEVALADGDQTRGIKLLEEAVEAGDLLNYDEPPDWDLPVREWLGRALLRGGQYSEAEKVYRAELVKHRNNGRALFGLAEALQKQKKTAAAQKARLKFAKAWATADTKLRSEDDVR